MLFARASSSLGSTPLPHARGALEQGARGALEVQDARGALEVQDVGTL